MSDADRTKAVASSQNRPMLALVMFSPTKAQKRSQRRNVTSCIETRINLRGDRDKI